MDKNSSTFGRGSEKQVSGSRDLEKSQDDAASTAPAYESQINARSKIIEILTKIETRHAFTDKLLDKELLEFNEPDRGLITEVVNGVLRWRYRLDWYLEQLYVGEYENLIPEVKINLRSSVYQLMFLDKIPPYAVLNEAVEIAKLKYNQKTANLVNAILRNFLRQQKKLELLEMDLDVLDRMAVRFSHPRWLLQRWIEYWGIDEVTRLCAWNNSRPRISVRINNLIADRDLFFKQLDENNIQYQVHPDFPDFVWINDFSEFRKLDLIRKGWVSVQDVSTGLPVLALDPQPGELVLDMCAAPGGKSSHIAEKMKNTGRLVSMDRYPGRVAVLRENLRRYEVQNAIVLSADGIMLPFKEKFDRILLDAPCTGFGVLNKRVDLRWKRSVADIENMQKIQLNLLKSAADAVKVGGIIVYSTCTIEPEENEQVVEKFLREFPEFRIEKLKGIIPDKYLWEKCCVRTFPHRHQMDGGYVARLRRLPR